MQSKALFILLDCLTEDHDTFVSGINRSMKRIIIFILLSSEIIAESEKEKRMKIENWNKKIRMDIVRHF